MAVQVIQSPLAAERLLKSDRLRILAHLSEPHSAAGLAKRMKIPRQKINYHLRELEKEGFVELVETRQKGNCLERMLKASARSYVISPAALGALGGDPSAVRDQFSAAFLVSSAARAIRDVATLRQRADKAGKRLATLTVETEIRFANPDARNRFAEELLNMIAQLVAKYHDDKTEDGRNFRLMVGAYPAITKREPVDSGSVNLE